MFNAYEPKPYKDHASTPPISIYVLNDDAPDMARLSCIFCKRTIADVKGNFDKIISSPLPVVDFGIAVNIRCKLCGCNYRLLMNAKG